MNAWKAFAVLVGFLFSLAPSRGDAQSTLEAASPARPSSPLPIVHEAVRVEVRDQTAQVTVEQHFRNDTSERLEGRYLFHTGGGARVHGFSYWNGEVEIVGEVFERESAREIYEDVTGFGRDPGLFEQVAEGTFSFRIFPIEPGEVKRVRVRYDVWLPLHGDVVSLKVPLSTPDARVGVHLRDGRGMESIDSVTHEVKIERSSSSEASISARRLGSGSEVFELRYRVRTRPLTMSAAMHRDEGHDGYVRLHLATPARVEETEITPKDVTIVIDRSGSMSGDPLEHARAAAAHVVRALGLRDRVNVVVFDHEAEALFPEPREVSDEIRALVLRRIERLESGGGTDIARALRAALRAQNRDDRPNVVLFLTDGQSDAQEALLALAEDVTDTRVFTVGLGSGVEKPLLSRIAATKRGRFVFIPDVRSIETEVARLFAQIAAPLLTDLVLTTDGAPMVDVYPRTLPDLFVDDELRIFARVVDGGTAAMEVRATLRGRLSGRPFVAEAFIRTDGALSDAAVGRGWAETRVQDLLEEIALRGESEELTSEVIDLALAYDMVTPYTAFLAIPASELTETAARTLASARERKRLIREAHPDAVALSRSQMPPGDPVIGVRAPRTARSVSAVFPFGLVLDLQWDDFTERWTSRFLVPNDVADGVYEVQVLIVHADGAVERARTEYVIDSAAQGVTFDVVALSEGIFVRVQSDEPLREARAVLDDGSEAVSLRRSGVPGCHFAVLPTTRGRHTLRVGATDLARNEVLEIRDVDTSNVQPEAIDLARACR